MKNRTTRQKMRYKYIGEIDRLKAKNGWDTKYNLVSTLQCEKPILKKVSLEKNFMPYLQFIVYDFEATLTPLNGQSTDDLTY